MPHAVMAHCDKLNVTTSPHPWLTMRLLSRTWTQFRKKKSFTLQTAVLHQHRCVGLLLAGSQARWEMALFGRLTP